MIDNCLTKEEQNKMDQRTTISPEITAKQNTRKNIVSRAFGYYLRPFLNPVKQRLLLKKWAHHSDHRTLDWDWSKANFNRVAVVNLLLQKFVDPMYLEIGCASDALFNSVPISKKIGVDPFSGGNVRKTSDDFFKTNELQFDVIFIDGLHTYEQVRRDVVNSMRFLKKGGWIALHDMLPRTWIEHHVPTLSRGAWTGDVWKVAFELAQTEGIEFKILKIDHGVGVIKVVDQNAKLQDQSQTLLHKEFSYFYDHLDRLPIVEWTEAEPWLRS